METYRITINNGVAAITTPYNPQFVAAVKKLGARWDAAGRVWTVDARLADDVRAAMRSVYGRDDGAEADLVTVIVTVHNTLRGHRESVVLFGRAIATAFGRDSGARIGEGVAFLDGEPESGGSATHWETIVRDGSRVKITDVPRALVRSTDDYTAEIVEAPGVDREALTAERERLMARIAEIDAILRADAE